MGFFSRGHRDYDYQPRYYKSEKEGNPYKMENKFDKFRSTVGSNRGLKKKFNNIMADAKSEGDRNMRVRMTVIISVLVFIFLYIIDFDLSIFFGS